MLFRSGLVGVTAGCDAVSPLGAAIMGAVFGIVIVLAVEFFDNVARIDAVSYTHLDVYKRQAADNARRIFDSLAAAEGLRVLCWRDVPCRPELLGAAARRSMPRIRQCFLARPADAAPGEAFDRRLYILRRQFEKQQTGAYVCSLSCRTIVYLSLIHILTEMQRSARSTSYMCSSRTRFSASRWKAAAFGAKSVYQALCHLCRFFL